MPALKSRITMSNEQVCRWANDKEGILRAYHDHEWGIPCHDDQHLYELLILESFQAGLSWLIVLKKREAFREALDQFNYRKIAAYDETKLNELMNDARLIRNKRKFNAMITNSQVFIKIQEEFGSFDTYIWSFTKGKVIKNKDDHIPTTSPLSDQISKDLIRRGMKFMGSITVYSYLGAIGVINDHELACCKY